MHIYIYSYLHIYMQTIHHTYIYTCKRYIYIHTLNIIPYIHILSVNKKKKTNKKNVETDLQNRRSFYLFIYYIVFLKKICGSTLKKKQHVGCQCQYEGVPEFRVPSSRSSGVRSFDMCDREFVTFVRPGEPRI